MSLVRPTMLTPPEQRWECPNCPQTAVTHEARPHTEFHACRGLRGMLAPMVPAGTKAKVELEERGDFVAGEHVRLDAEGRPWMAAVVTRDDGVDRAVYAPTAVATAEEVSDARSR